MNQKREGVIATISEDIVVKGSKRKPIDKFASKMLLNATPEPPKSK
jgi:hypothetical protein